MLKEHGAVIIDADEIARRIVAPGLSAWRELVDEFGREILNDNGTINPKSAGRQSI
jgi:dephospho-CoA kinase